MAFVRCLVVFAVVHTIANLRRRNALVVGAREFSISARRVFFGRKSTLEFVITQRNYSTYGILLRPSYLRNRSRDLKTKR